MFGTLGLATAWEKKRCSEPLQLGFLEASNMIMAMTETDLGNITPAGSSLSERWVPDICAPGEACQKQW